MLYELLTGYFLLISGITFILFGLDKRKARHGKRRISESRLLIFSLLGGSIGALAAMYLFRHKTRHLKFTLGIPLLLLLQIAVVFYFTGGRGKCAHNCSVPVQKNAVLFRMNDTFSIFANT